MPFLFENRPPSAPLQLAKAEPLGKVRLFLRLPFSEATLTDTDVLFHWFKSLRQSLSFLWCQEMSDDVSLGVEQKRIRSAEVLAPTPEHFLDYCLRSSTQLTLR